MLRVNSVVALTFGSGGTAAGLIELEDGTTIHGFISIGDDRMLSTQYSVPRNKELRIDTFWASLEDVVTADCNLKLMYRETGKGSLTWVEVASIELTAENRNANFKFNTPVVIPEKSDIRVLGDATVDASIVTAGYSGLLDWQDESLPSVVSS
jgi:hypothetical protein